MSQEGVIMNVRTLRLVTAADDDIYVTSAAFTPRVLILGELRGPAIDRRGVVDALAVVRERPPSSGVRRKGGMDLEGM